MSRGAACPPSPPPVVAAPAATAQHIHAPLPRSIQHVNLVLVTWAYAITAPQSLQVGMERRGCADHPQAALPRLGLNRRPPSPAPQPCRPSLAPYAARPAGAAASQTTIGGPSSLGECHSWERRTRALRLPGRQRLPIRSHHHFSPTLCPAPVVCPARSGSQLLMVQMPDIDHLKYSSIIGGLMSFGYSGIAVGLSAAEGAQPCSGIDRTHMRALPCGWRWLMRPRRCCCCLQLAATRKEPSAARASRMAGTRRSRWAPAYLPPAGWAGWHRRWPAFHSWAPPSLQVLNAIGAILFAFNFSIQLVEIQERRAGRVPRGASALLCPPLPCSPGVCSTVPALLPTPPAPRRSLLLPVAGHHQDRQ